MNTTEARDFDVIIVGAGPTGLTLANLLGMRGIRTLLIERNGTTVDEPRAVSIDDEALRTMQSIGLADEVVRDLTLDYGTEYVGRTRRTFARVEPTSMEYGYPRRSAFRQPLLEATLRSGVDRFSCVAVQFNTELVALQQSTDEVIATVQTKSGSRQVYTSSYLVGADGASSTTRRLLGVSLSGRSFEQRWLVVDTENDDDMSRNTRVFADSRRPAITLPGPHGTRRWEFLLHDGEMSAAMLGGDVPRQMLRSHGVGETVEIHRTTVYSFHARVAERWMVGRILLAGDAAHLSPPYAGQGMNSGIRDAANLGWKLAMAAGGDLSAQALESYEIERRHHAWEMIRLALMIGRVMTPTSRRRELAQEWLVRLAGIVPQVRSYLIEMKFKPKPRFESGLVIPNGLKASIVGRMIPQPMVSGSHGAPVRLDDILGADHALLVFGRSRHSLDSLDCVDRCDWLRPTTVNVLPRHQRPVDDVAAQTVVRDDGGLECFLSGTPSDHAILVRPDRYVAATFPAALVAQGLRQYERLLTA